MGISCCEKELKDSTSNIPPDSPLGRMLRDWGQKQLTCTQGKDEGKMIQNFMSEQTKEPI